MNLGQGKSMIDSTSGKSSPILIARLAIMMFLQFFVWGAWYVAVGGFLQENGLGKYGAAAYTVAPIAAIFAPLSLGLIVDRLFNTERVLGLLSIVGAGLLWWAPMLADPGANPDAPVTFISQFMHPMILCLLAYMVCFMPTLALTASLSFKHLANGEKEFPIVRVLGTIGWIFGGWVMWACRLFTGESTTLADAQAAFALASKSGEASTIQSAQTVFDTTMSTLSYTDNSLHIFHAAAIASLVLGVYCFTLPRTAPPAKGEPISIGKIFGVDAWDMLKDKAFFVFALSSFLTCIPLAGYYANGYVFVDGTGTKLFGSATGAMSTGQMSEILFMLAMPFCFARLGVKKMLVIGIAAWVLRYGLWGFAFGQEGPMLTLPVFIGILLHGICYDFFFVTGMIYTDKKADPAIRGQAQSLIVMLTQGLGLGIGAQAFGWWLKRCTVSTPATEGSKELVETVDYSMFWYAPALFALGVLVFFMIAFWDRSGDEKAA